MEQGLELSWEFGGNLVGIWWYFLNLIINKLNHFLGIWWEFGGNLVGIWWEFETGKWEKKWEGNGKETAGVGGWVG